MDEALFNAVDRAVDNLCRRGEATPENIKAAVAEIFESRESKA